MNCPACGSPVTLEIGPERPPSTSLRDAVLGADADERFAITRDCWDCGWHEMRQLRVESIETTAGDDAAVWRAALVAELTDELAGIDSVETLEGTLVAICRQRRTDLVTTDTDDDATE